MFKLLLCCLFRSDFKKKIFLRTTWKKCCFSGDGEYICAGSARQHALYIWEKATGVLMKILHGTKGEVLLDVVVNIFSLKIFLLMCSVIKNFV